MAVSVIRLIVFNIQKESVLFSGWDEQVLYKLEEFYEQK